MRNEEEKKGHSVNDKWYFSESFYAALNLTISAVSGFLGSLLWVSEGKYISDCATDETKGFYFSYFWAIYMTS